MFNFLCMAMLSLLCFLFSPAAVGMLVVVGGGYWVFGIYYFGSFFVLILLSFAQPAISFIFNSQYCSLVLLFRGHN